MKYIISVILGIFGFSILCSQPVLGQSEATLYMQIGYMQVPHGHGAEYVQLEQDIWKPIHEERLNRGFITGWKLYGVQYAEPDADYDYVTVNFYDELANVDQGYSQEVFQEVHPDLPLEEISDRTYSAREIVHREIWRLVDAAQPLMVQGPNGRYLVVDFKQVPSGRGSAYVSMEREDWKPVHQVRIDRGTLNGWALNSLVLPGGVAMEYNFSTFNFFESLGQLGEPWTMDLWRNAHPNAAEEDFQAMWNRASEFVDHKREVWEFITSVGGSDE